MKFPKRSQPKMESQRKERGGGKKKKKKEQKGKKEKMKKLPNQFPGGSSPG
jgi:hypothetical protein